MVQLPHIGDQVAPEAFQAPPPLVEGAQVAGIAADDGQRPVAAHARTGGEHLRQRGVAAAVELDQIGAAAGSPNRLGAAHDSGVDRGHAGRVEVVGVQVGQRGHRPRGRQRGEFVAEREQVDSFGGRQARPLQDEGAVTLQPGLEFLRPWPDHAVPEVAVFRQTVFEGDAHDQCHAQPGTACGPDLRHHPGGFTIPGQLGAVPTTLAGVEHDLDGVQSHARERADPAIVVRLVDLHATEHGGYRGGRPGGAGRRPLGCRCLRGGGRGGCSARTQKPRTQERCQRQQRRRRARGDAGGAWWQQRAGRAGAAGVRRGAWAA